MKWQKNNENIATTVYQLQRLAMRSWLLVTGNHL